MNDTELDLPLCINTKLKRYFSLLGGEEPNGVLKMVIRDVEPIIIKFVLEHTNNNKSETSRILGINRLTLAKKIKMYNL
jgi:Fis family transcriptional regulator